MRHLGDITKLSGFQIPIVDVITGGSPCQDLSVAGKRAGLKGERSGLFMEQMRIVKEMRERDRLSGRTGIFIRPRYMVWENVPGAFSGGSPKGADFAAVIEEIIKVAEPGANINVCIPDRGWTKSGCYYSEDGTWSVAWRVHDAQFWGVPQRRKRIALVADFGGLTAPEILFERKGLSGNFEESGTPRQRAAGAIKDSAGSASGVFCLQGNGIDRADTAGCNGKGWREDISYTLNTIDRPAIAFAQNQRNEIRDLKDVVGALAAESGRKQQTFVCAGFKAAQSMAGGIGYQEECAPTLSSQMSGVEPTVFDARGNGNGTIAPTVTGDHNGRVSDYTALCCEIRLMAMQSYGDYKDSEVASRCKARDYKDATDLVVAGLDCRNGRENGDLCGTLQSKPNGGFSYNCIHPIRDNNIVRRLTPLECERLQGFPDGWTDIGEWTDSKGKKHKEADTPRYKALGNSIALPFWQYLARRICAQYEHPVTMGSLFDGIGGFPLVFERCGAKAVWASEIEEFPIAVTKYHFGGQN